MARSFVVVAFLLFALCFSCILARKAPGVEPSVVNRKAPLKVPLVGPKAPLKAPLAGPKTPHKAPVVGSKAPPKAPVAGPKVPLKAPLSGPKALLAGPKAPLTGTKTPSVVPKAPKKAPLKAPLTRTKAPVKAPFVVPKAPKKAPLKAPLSGTKAPVKAPFAVPKAPKKAPLGGPKVPLVGPKAPLAKPFKVVGQIYCDPCRFEVMSKRSTPLKGVKVNLECRKADSNKVTYVKEGITDANGAYKILVGGDHKGEICEVKPEQPRNGICTEPMTKKSDRIVFTKNSSMTLIANPLGFMTKAADGQCRQDDKELNLDTYVAA